MAISRRHYAEVIAFLKQTVKNPKASLRLRMSAAERLDDIFARHQADEERALQRKERSETRKTEATKGTPIPAEETTIEQTPEELAEQQERDAINALLGRVPDAPRRF